MTRAPTTELLMIRHAPVVADGRLAGRRDVAADFSAVSLAGLTAEIVGAALVASPARRCLDTAAALCPGQTPETDPRLWEQDFGAWEGLPFADLPDLGPLTGAALAAHRPPGGESFANLCARVAPALEALAARGGRVAVVAHAGVVRAALARAMGDVAGNGAGALAFQVAPLSLTRIIAAPGGWSIACVNRVLA